MSPVTAAASASPRTLAVALVGTTTTRLRRALEAGGLRVAAAVRTPPALASRAAGADVVVLTLPASSTDAADQARAVRQAAPGAAIVVVSRQANLRELRVLLTEGVAGLVLEDDAPGSLVAAVRAASVGLLAFPGSLRQTLVKPVLSAREKQVLGLVVLGLTNSEIAGKLHLTESTVKSHLSSSFAKLGARSRSEATALILDPTTGLGTGILTIAGEQ